MHTVLYRALGLLLAFGIWFRRLSGNIFGGSCLYVSPWVTPMILSMGYAHGYYWLNPCGIHCKKYAFWRILKGLKYITTSIACGYNK